MTCSCPDWGVPCKHLSAVLYLLAEAFDDDPFLVLAWRGREREELLGALRGAVADGRRRPTRSTCADVPLEDCSPTSTRRAVSLARLRELPGGPTAPPELLLRVLDPPAVGCGTSRWSTCSGPPTAALRRRRSGVVVDDQLVGHRAGLAGQHVAGGRARRAPARSCAPS